MHAVLALASLAQWRTVTVYDVLPESCRFSISNNDVGNVPGDMYFNIKDKYLPVACVDCLKVGPQGCRSPSTFDCTNVESTGNLVVRKLEVEVYGDFDGEAYNLCDVWPHSAACEYSCFSPHMSHRATGVGREAVCGGEQAVGDGEAAVVGGEATVGGAWPSRQCTMAPEPSTGHTDAWDYWNFNTAALFGNTGKGEWYSLVAKDEGTYWRNATVLKVINQRCQARALDKLVASIGSKCFSGCTQPTNQSSACWIDCFFSTVLGPSADRTLKPPGSQAGAMSVDDLAAAWLSGFGSDDPNKGGCAPCPASGECPDTDASEDAGAVVTAARHAPRPHAPLAAAAAATMVEAARR